MFSRWSFDPTIRKGGRGQVGPVTDKSKRHHLDIFINFHSLSSKAAAADGGNDEEGEDGEVGLVGLSRWELESEVEELGGGREGGGGGAGRREGASQGAVPDGELATTDAPEPLCSQHNHCPLWSTVQENQTAQQSRANQMEKNGKDPKKGSQGRDSHMINNGNGQPADSSADLLKSS